MNADQALALTSLIGAMVLVGASVMVRGLPKRLISRLILAWVVIFAAAYLLVSAFR